MTLKLVPPERTELAAREERPCYLTKEMVRGHPFFAKTYDVERLPKQNEGIWFRLTSQEAMLNIDTLAEMERFGVLADSR